MFVPYVKEGKMFGRGSLDMKSFAAVGLNSLEYVLKQQLPLKFGVLLSSDEEKGSFGLEAFFTRQSRPQVQNRVGRRRCRRYRKNRRPLQSPVFVKLFLQRQGKLTAPPPGEGIDANEQLMQVWQNIRTRYPYFCKNVPKPADTGLTPFILQGLKAALPPTLFPTMPKPCSISD